MNQLDGIGSRKKRLPASPLKTTSRRPPARPTPKNVGPMTVIAIFLILAVAFYSYYQSQIVPPATVSPQTRATTPAITETINTGSVLTNSITTINIYNSGAGNEATKTAIGKLEAADFAINNLAQSQLTYDKTYVWYRPEFENDAKKIKTVLADREVVIAPIHITGSFDLLIYLGKK